MRAARSFPGSRLAHIAMGDPYQQSDAHQDGRNGRHHRIVATRTFPCGFGSHQTSSADRKRRSRVNDCALFSRPIALGLRGRRVFGQVIRQWRDLPVFRATDLWNRSTAERSVRVKRAFTRALVLGGSVQR